VLKPPHSKRSRDLHAFTGRAQRLECGAFTAAVPAQARMLPP